VPLSTVRARQRERLAVALAAIAVLGSIALVLAVVISPGASSHPAVTPTPPQVAAAEGSSTPLVQQGGQARATSTEDPTNPQATATEAPTADFQPPAPAPSANAGATDAPPGPTPPPTMGPVPVPAPPLPTSVEPEQLTGYEWPIHTKGARLMTYFEPESTGVGVIDHQRIHLGLDIATFCGDRVRAAHDGTVVSVGRRFEDAMDFNGSTAPFYAWINRKHALWTLPIVIVIDDGNGYRSAYVHLERTSVHVGERVQAGKTIGYEGMTGNATGCHLHWEVFRTDGSWMPIAPQLVKEFHYPTAERIRVDPFRFMNLEMQWAPHMVPGIPPPKVSPGLGRHTVH